MAIEILVTTMNQTEFSKIEEMNIQSNVIFANQSDRNDYKEIMFNDKTAKMITTTTRGTSKNRNIAISFLNSGKEYIMFSDDDLTFLDGYEKKILEEFVKHPHVDAIKFNLNCTSKNRTLSMKPTETFKRANFANITAGGVCGLVIKRDVLVKSNLHFNEYFGPGTKNYCGEDTIFLQEMVRKKIKFYLSPVTIADIDLTESSWFEGYNEKYFNVVGKIFAYIYPKLARLIAIRSAYKFSKRKKCNMRFFDILKYYNQGIDKMLK